MHVHLQCWLRWDSISQQNKVSLHLYPLQDRRVSQTLNPFKRDFRKSIFRDGAVFSNWMERVHEYGIEVGVAYILRWVWPTY